MPFTFSYLRAGDRVMVPIDPPLTTMKEAEEGRDMMVGAGATCSDIKEIAGNPDDNRIAQAKEKSYVDGKIEEFRVYLKKELAVLDSVHCYQIIYDYIHELAPRIKRYFKERYKDMVFMDSFPAIREKDCVKRYLDGVKKALNSEAIRFSPLDGSVPEDIGNTLKKITKQL